VSNELTKKRNIYFVILAGGSGTRLWPLSTSQCPKQLLTLVQGKTLLEHTIELVRTYYKMPIHVWVSTSHNHVESIKAVVGSLVDYIVIEPSARNTGPAILYSCLRIYETDPDAIVLFLPADSYIPPEDALQFVNAAEQALSFASSHEAITLLGVKPSYPATSYGYIEYVPETVDQATGLHQVKMFHEKPTLETAQEYIKCVTTLWNIGMFGARASVFLHEFKLHAPELYSTVFDSVYHNASFDEAPSIPIDYALIERSACVWVLPVNFSWCDVGNLGIFLALKQRAGGLLEKVLTHNSSNNLIDVPDKLVALVGVNNLCIVQTKDTLLIMHIDEVENVRAIVNQLKKQQWYEYM